MRYIINDNTDAYFNLAAEEYLLKHTEEEVFSLWRNDNAIIVGKNQNTVSEINTDFVKEKGIKVVRRLTGGGAVYHDLGNLNYTFIVNSRKSFNDFLGFSKPIIAALKDMGVAAEFSGRNDMTIQGQKFSGNAQCRHRERVMHHGTLLFSSVKADISGALRPRDVKFTGKSVKSVASRITNISDHLDYDMDVLTFRNRLMAFITGSEDAQITGFTEAEIRAIEELRSEKYSQWDWNYGESPKFAQTKEARTSGGTLEVTLEVTAGRIGELRIYGDFFGTEDVADLEAALLGVPHEESALRGVLEQVDLNRYVVNLTQEEFLELIL